MNINEELGLVKRFERSMRAPMKYPGSKFDNLDDLLPHLPMRGGFIDVFGGSGVVLFNRRSSKLEVYNDRFGGIVAFYRALRERPKELVDRLEMTIHSREEWEWCYKTWNDDQLDDVERAARWFYMIQYSFVGLGRSFARITKPTSGVAGTLNRKLPGFWNIHQRLQNVQIENLDWSECIKDYDNEDHVVYLDPPYMDSDTSGYSHQMTKTDHARMMETVMNMKSYVVVSGYPNEMYNSYKWEGTHSWPRRDRANGHAISEYNNRSEVGERKIMTEQIWIHDPRKR